MPAERRIAVVLVALAVVLGVATVMVYRTPTTTPADAVAAGELDGATVFRAKGCVVCHVGPGTAGESLAIGPDLSEVAEHAGSRVEGLSDTEYVRQSILAPGAFRAPFYGEAEMPTLLVSAPELDALVAYLLAGPEQ